MKRHLIPQILIKGLFRNEIGLTRAEFDSALVSIFERYVRSLLKYRKQSCVLLRNMRLPKNSKILEVGCGFGLDALEFARNGHSVTAVDSDEPCLIWGRNRADEEGLRVEFINQDMNQIEYSNEFDAAINFYTPYPNLARLHRALKPGGYLYITLNPEDSRKALIRKGGFEFLPHGEIGRKVLLRKLWKIPRVAEDTQCAATCRASSARRSGDQSAGTSVGWGRRVNRFGRSRVGRD